VAGFTGTGADHVVEARGRTKVKVRVFPADEG
jgi:hypothetical protein